MEIPKLQHTIIWIVLSLQFSACNHFIPIIPEHCLGQSICEDVPNYPYEYVDGIIKQLDKQGYFWRSDADSDSVSQPGIYSDRDMEFVEICPSVVRRAIPLAAQVSEGQWRFVVNRKELSPQVIHMEVCKVHVMNRTCGENLRHIDIHVKTSSVYSARCKQGYLDRELTIIEEYGKVNLKSVINTPTCCSCAVYHEN